MSEEREIEVYQSRVFEKAFKRLSEEAKDRVDEEIGKLIDDPTLGVQKQGDLAHLRVHKFKLENSQVLLGYSWIEQQLVLYLLNLGPHENFYRDARRRRNADLKLIR